VAHDCETELQNNAMYGVPKERAKKSYGGRKKKKKGRDESENTSRPLKQKTLRSASITFAYGSLTRGSFLNIV
jgi:hypothetical protein